MGEKVDGLGFIFQLYLSITKGHMGLSAGKRFSSVIKCKKYNIYPTGLQILNKLINQSSSSGLVQTTFSF